MSIENRPYVGTWKIGQQKVVQHTPDALVYINGDMALPGCPKCNSRIDIQQFVTEVSVDAGTEPGAASASFTLSVPVHHTAAFARDARFLLRPGLEVHIYERGYFPVKGLFSNLDVPQTPSAIRVPTELPTTTTTETTATGGPLTREALAAQASQMGITPDLYMAAIVARSEGGGRGGEYVLHSLLNRQVVSGGSLLDVALGGANSTGQNGSEGRQYDSQHIPTGRDLEQRLTQVRNVLDDRIRSGSGWTNNQRRVGWFRTKNGAAAAVQLFYDNRISEGHPFLATVDNHMYFGYGTAVNAARARALAQDILAPGATPAPTTPSTATDNGLVQREGSTAPTLSEFGLSGYDIEKILAYPYYHVFHGVVVQVGSSYSGGVQNITVQCQSMLHFWQYHVMGTNASIFGARPNPSKNKVSLLGHNFTGWHPYEIIYALHYDTAGAAAGVSWALGKKTNQTARSEITGESLFSLNIKYWERRFASRMIRLRLHGATGELFNSAQASFLGRKGARELTSLLRSRFGTFKGEPPQILSQALRVGLGNKKRLEALIYARRSRPDGDVSPQFEISLPEMHAFVKDLGIMGNLQLFESTYESKLDIVQKVCDLTGFEFYQDVDGDFVFKPPFYNLDTSGSRVYRIEDIDIINISFDEKEPQATYAVCKGSQFANVTGLGLENEWGVQGQYIDYRLVAQFGWRPMNFDTAYFNDGKSMFFAAVNRMALLNAPMNSASVTIPLRPELRPGYPVYIPYLDCYYYCNSFAHSFSVGGQCTTTLQLVAKRAKFFAPGDPTQRGVEAIHLERTYLPQRPLEVHDNAGRPRLSGFPNVVMALDPNDLNPLFFLVGADIESLESRESLVALLKMAVRLNVVRTEDPSNPGPYYTMSVDATRGVTFYLADPDAASPTSLRDAHDLVAAAREMARIRQQQAASLAQEKTAVRQIEVRIARIDNELANMKEREGEVRERKEAERRALVNERTNAENAFQNSITSYESQLDGESRYGVSFLRDLIKRTGQAFFASDKYSASFDLNNSATLLDMLSDKKAVFTTSCLPGSYRYYSVSHPDRVQQGQMDLTLDLRTGATARVQQDNPFTEPAWMMQEVTGFLSSDRITMTAGEPKPESRLGTYRPTWGLRVLTSNPSYANGEILPTSAITELMFAAHQITQITQKGSTTQREILAGLPRAFYAKFLQSAVNTDGVISAYGNNPLTFMLEDWLADFNSAISHAVEAAKTSAGDSTDRVPIFVSIPFPLTMNTAKGSALSTDTALSTYKFQDTNGTVPAFPGSEKVILKTYLPKAARAVADAVYNGFVARLYTWVHDLEAALNNLTLPGTKNRLFDKVLSAFNETLFGHYGVKARGRGYAKASVDAPITTAIHSPVFPVSDDRGYEVIGSYRYGRGVDLEPNGVFDVLHRQDPYSVVDQKTLDDFLAASLYGQPIFVDIQTDTTADGSPRYQRRMVTGSEAVGESGRRMLQSLRETFTDQELLDLKVVAQTDEPGVLEFRGMNWYSDKGKEGIQKLPLNNAAYSLADLTAGLPRATCTCRAAEADVLLDIAGQQNFVGLAPPSDASTTGYGTTPMDETNAWLAAQATETGVPWRLSQDAMRGTAPAEYESVVATARQVADQFRGMAWDEVLREKERLLDAARAGFSSSGEPAAPFGPSGSK